MTDWLSKVTGYGYEDAGRLGITSTQGAATVISFTYALDNAGLRTAVLDPAGTESYAYDSLYRLTAVTYTDGLTQTYAAACPERSRRDAGGNRLTKADPSRTTSYTYDNADRMTAAGGVSYAYDSNGNQTGRGADAFGWDALNRMVTATVASTNITYTYRSDDLRNTKMAAGATTTYTWDVNAGLPVVLQDGTYTYVYGLGLVSQTDGSGNRTYLLANGLGSTEKLTDGAGTVVGTYKYDAFGALRSSSGTGSTEYRFTGQQDDAPLGYQYLRARYYDPAIGRFISRDPFEGFVTNPATQYPYAYAADNPSNLSDATGRCWTCLIQRYGVPVLDWIQRNAPRLQQWAQAGAQRGQRFLDWCTSRFAQESITISEERLSHVLERHIQGGAGAIGTSIFSHGENIPALIREAAKVVPVQQAGGNFQRIVDAGRAIGIDRATGQPTSIYTVITNAANELITAFPGTPGVIP